MIIESKKHSSEIIKKLRLNGVPEFTFLDYDEEAINNFCKKYPSTKYILRDLDNPNGQYFFCKNVQECIDGAKKYT